MSIHVLVTPVGELSLTCGCGCGAAINRSMLAVVDLRRDGRKVNDIAKTIGTSLETVMNQRKFGRRFATGHAPSKPDRVRVKPITQHLETTVGPFSIEERATLDDKAFGTTYLSWEELSNEDFQPNHGNKRVADDSPLTIEQNQLVADNYDAALSSGYFYGRTYYTALGPEGVRDAAVEALIGCARRFDASRGYKFMSFYDYRIKGALVDAYRQKFGRRIKKPLEILYEGFHGSDVIDGDSADTWMEELSVLDLHDEPDDRTAQLDPDIVRRIFADCSSRLREVVSLFLDDYSMADIGEEVGVTESRVCRLMGEFTVRYARLCGTTPKGHLGQSSRQRSVLEKMLR